MSATQHVGGVLEQAIIDAQRPLIEELHQIKQQLELLALAKVASKPVVEMLTVTHAAKHAGYSEKTIRKWIRDGRLKATQIDGREYRVASLHLSEFLQGSSQTTEAESSSTTELVRHALALVNKKVGGK